MVNIIPRAPSFAEEFAKNLGAGFSHGIEQSQKAFSEASVARAKQQEKLKLLTALLGGTSGPNVEKDIGAKLQDGIDTSMQSQNKLQGDLSKSRPEEDFTKAIVLDNIQHGLGQTYLQNIQNQKKDFREERKYHTDLTKESQKEVEQLRSSLPKKQMALSLARQAIQSGDLSFFSKDKLADITGIDAFRTAQGAELITASKENLLSNMSRVSSKAQNIWFEQRLNSMFPKIGNSKEANFTIQEMLEGEEAMDKAYIEAYDRLAQEDNERYGFERKDIAKRAREATKSINKEILDRTSYRIKELEEQQKGLSFLKKQAGKNVVPGTPLTLAMAKVYKDKFGKDALAVAKKNGYKIPTLEEFKIYRSEPSQFYEQIEQ